jgi:hypothetical protein
MFSDFQQLELVFARYGGAIFQDTCMDSKECGFLGISSSAGASTVLLDSNVAGYQPLVYCLLDAICLAGSVLALSQPQNKD